MDAPIDMSTWTDQQRKTYAALQIAVQYTGQRQAVMRPLVANIPAPAKPNWQIIRCARCQFECWITPLEPPVLPEHCFAVCTECALRAGAKAAREARS